MPVSSITFIIPTLGERPESLDASVRACLEVENSIVRIVGPNSAHELVRKLVSERVTFVDEGAVNGAAGAINAAICSSPITTPFFTWVGDDDFLAPLGIADSVALLTRNLDAVGTYGIVNYIDLSNKLIRVHRPPRNPKFSLRFGPQRVAQPGMLFRTSILGEIGNLDEKFLCAWDQEFMVRCITKGKLAFVKSKVADYTWHDGALTSTFLKRSLIESAQIRAAAFPWGFTQIWLCVEYMRIVLTLAIGTRLTKAGDWVAPGELFRKVESDSRIGKF